VSRLRSRVALGRLVRVAGRTVSWGTATGRAGASAKDGSRSSLADQRDLKHELTLTFDELALIDKSLQAVKALGALPPQDELLNDTIQLVDQALNAAIR
jgi:hypothetical protein